MVLVLDDGTRVPVNRASVAGVEGSDDVSSEYFRALLRGGFGEAQAGEGEAVHIRDVTAGMLVPLVHYLHGCRFSEDAEVGKRRKCQMLDTLLLDGLNVCKNGTEEPLETDLVFQRTGLAEMMIGASRFLVNELQRELEDLCVSQLLFRYTTAATKDVSAPAEDKDQKTKPKMDQECGEFAEKNLDSRTSELELTGHMKKLSSILQEMERKKTFVGAAQKVSILDRNAIRRVTPDSKSADRSAELMLGPKTATTGPTAPVTEAAQACSGAVAAGKALASLLPQVYWFSQRYCYPALGRACLSWLLDCPHTFLSSSVGGDCLRRLAREAECRETLKQDLLSLASSGLG